MTTPPDDQEPVEIDLELDDSVIWHDPIDLETSEGSDIRGFPVIEAVSSCDVVHDIVELEVDFPDALGVAFHFPAEIPPAPITVAGVILALRDFEQSLGGHGLSLDGCVGESPDELCLVLSPSRSTGAVERFRKIAKALDRPLEETPADHPHPGGNGLYAAVEKVLQGASLDAPDLAALRETAERFRLRLRHLRQAS